MKTHKITEFNILPDRRKPVKPEHVYHVRRYTPDKRKNPHAYPSDKLIIEVPLEVQPRNIEGFYQWDDPVTLCSRGAIGEEALIKILMECSPCQKDDILALGEPWGSIPLVDSYDTLWRNILKHHKPRFDKQPASTCPISIARKVKVERVLGVEEKVTSGRPSVPTGCIGITDPVFHKIWHSIILAEEI